MLLSKKTKIVLGVGIFLFSLGLLLMYDSGFLLHPSGYVTCSGQCYYYEYVYPIKRAEFWMGLLVSVISTLPLGIGTYQIRNEKK